MDRPYRPLLSRFPLNDNRDFSFMFRLFFRLVDGGPGNAPRAGFALDVKHGINRVGSRHVGSSLRSGAGLA